MQILDLFANTSWPCKYIMFEYSQQILKKHANDYATIITLQKVKVWI